MSDDIIPNGCYAIVTEDWSYTSTQFGDTHSGTKGTSFKVDIYIPKEKSDSGFAFYRGTIMGGRAEFLCPADKARIM